MVTYKKRGCRPKTVELSQLDNHCFAIGSHTSELEESASEAVRNRREALAKALSVIEVVSRSSAVLVSVRNPDNFKKKESIVQNPPPIPVIAVKRSAAAMTASKSSTAVEKPLKPAKKKALSGHKRGTFRRVMREGLAAGL